MAFTRSQGRIRAQVARSLNIKFAPTLTFKKSLSRQHQAEMDLLFDSIAKDLNKPTGP